MQQLAVVFGAALLFGFLTYRFRALTASGSVAGALFAGVLIANGEAAWIAPALAFFVLSSSLSFLGSARKRASARYAAKGSRRDAGQVMANGGVAFILLVLYLQAPHPLLYWGYLGALAAATADTWATEIGTLIGGQPRMLLTGKTVPTGTSGAVSPAGTIAAAAGAAAVWAAVVPFASGAPAPMIAVSSAVSVVVSGLIGAASDSLLGATMQAQYLTPTGDWTELPAQAGAGGVPGRGQGWVTNDVVNWVCTVTGSAAAIAFGIILQR